ncbi:hypothetical protein A3F03_02290 [Candidatus Roizmanbacteria bacterium RIFCSPHIGHO2_12_FULL_41_11]|uniref:Cohesin domain-containing protein n=3 Tax=Candidatus Roizmaniibacteriota TaxID=1752723 RepID=A0A1F7JQN9_9BACT|nr:MAG: hypothetical protein A3F03_02290 [Candidatus Roizmanbacteria bacterium RIFCSPHIGHO2_12_FULL_41_11]OGK51655.1 MAG: hypothetical protein A2966_05005 [Candidatus Roizmanbacteria bacterium RIFCSPLOWO2_01_FULL_41_22]OGK57915.1 MAG: hypothetical protein A3H86_01580 [Candidatus Roizmanbacteria bacterium RIFCSPLOWO2_02_FULL_41_9]
MKRIAILIGFLIFFSFSFLWPTCVYGAQFSILPTSVTVRRDAAFTLEIYSQSGLENVSGEDVYISYDPQFLEINKTPDLQYDITTGSIFPKIGSIIGANYIYLYGVHDDKNTTQKANGLFAKISFKAKQAGETTLALICAPGSATSSKIIRQDNKLTNILECANASNNQLTVKIAPPDVLGTSVKRQNQNKTPSYIVQMTLVLSPILIGLLLILLSKSKKKEYEA